MDLTRLVVKVSKPSCVYGPSGRDKDPGCRVSFRPFDVQQVVAVRILSDPSARATRIHTPHTPSPAVSPPKFGNEHERLGVGAGGGGGALFGGGAAYEHERFGEGRGAGAYTRVTRPLFSTT
jgi:hypothetical protein